MAKSGKKSAYMPKPWDIAIILVPLIAAALVLFMPISAQSGAFAKITVDGKVVDIISLEQDTPAPLDYNLRSHNLIEVSGGSIRIISADCENQTCVKTGGISKKGQIIACVPSGLVIEIEGGGFDAVTG